MCHTLSHTVTLDFKSNEVKDVTTVFQHFQNYLEWVGAQQLDKSNVSDFLLIAPEGKLKLLLAHGQFISLFSKL